MKILLISYYFAPNNTIAAVRTTKIAKYLTRFCHEVDVLCGRPNLIDPILQNDMKYIKNIKIIEGAHILEKMRKNKNISNNDSKLPARYLKVIDKLLKNSIGLQKWIIFDAINSYVWASKCIKYLRKNCKNYNIVIASFGPIGSLLVGNWVRKYNLSQKYVIDIRDAIIPEYITIRSLKLLYERIQKNSFSLADHAVAVSDGIKLYLKQAGYEKNISIITNGYDPEDFFGRRITNENENEDKIVFCYAGVLYEGKSDIRKLFHALHLIIAENSIFKDKLLFLYAGKDISLISNIAKEFSLEYLVRTFGYIPRDRVFQLFDQSDILVMATWNTEKEKGVLTGKFFEYLYFKKPIISFVSGDKNAEIERIIVDLNIGMTFYNDHTDIALLKEFIINEYDKKIHKKRINIAVDTSKYSYSELVLKYHKLITAL